MSSCHARGMRSYGQWDGVAKALDLVGDRWSLLIVRELSIRGPLRYTDLHRGIPGIATNLLADRIRELESTGIIARAISDVPGGPQLIRLTTRGERLRPVLQALARWGAADLPDAPTTDVVQAHWLTIPLEATLRDRKPDRGRAVLEVRAGDTPIQVEVGDGIRTSLGPAASPDAVISGDPRTVLAVLLGRMGLEEAQAAGVSFRGDPKLLRRIRP
jgi:DNA-binding HxlR family transcriptional regulator